MDGKIPATATVLTYNSARTITECLRSLQGFAEVLVLDGGSTDETVEIARAFEARVEQQAERPGLIVDFTAVRERSFTLARYDWIFVIDADEFADPELIAGIRQAVLTNNPAIAYRLLYVPIVDGQVVEHAFFMPFLLVRLTQRSMVGWKPGKTVHEKWDFAPGVRLALLPGKLHTRWPEAAALRRKHLLYLALAFSKTPPRRMTPLQLLVSAVKNMLLAFRIGTVGIWLVVRYGRTALPWSFTSLFVSYHFAIARERIRQCAAGDSYVPPAA